jgi:hypothetical protein
VVSFCFVAAGGQAADRKEAICLRSSASGDALLGTGSWITAEGIEAPLLLYLAES